MKKLTELSSLEVKKDLLNFIKGGDGPTCSSSAVYADSIYVKPTEPIKEPSLPPIKK